MKELLNNKIFQIFFGVLVLVVVIFVGIIAVTNYYSHKEELAKEVLAFKDFKQKQVEKDILKINQEVSSNQFDEYSDFNHRIETPDNIVESINGGYCSESTFLGPEKTCNEKGQDSYECIRLSKCRMEKYTPEFMHKIIADHAMIENDINQVNEAKSIYDRHPNWDIYSIVLAAQGSINKRMLKEAALSVWGGGEVDRTEKIEQDYDAVWFWKKDCINNLFTCEGGDVSGYKRDVLVFNKNGSLFYYLLDK